MGKDKKNPMKRMMEEDVDDSGTEDMFMEFDLRDVVIATFLKIMTLEDRIKKLEEEVK